MGAGRNWTVSIALPGSIVANAQSAELQTYLAGQIARAAAIFCIDEIIVFSDCGYGVSGTEERKAPRTRPGTAADPDVFLARCLAYLETPQYLRRHLFPMHQDLKFAGLLNPLDAPHHLRADEVLRWREGVVVKSNGEHAPPSSGTTEDEETGDSKSNLVDVGFTSLVKVPDPAPCGTRVTVDMGDGDRVSAALRNSGRRHGRSNPPPLAAKGISSPDAPRELGGFYWGYRVRLAGTLGSVFRGDSWSSGYDVVMGTSEKGVPVDSPEVSRNLEGFERLLIVFGGVPGLEESVNWDPVLSKKGCGKSWKVDDLFDLYVNTCPSQGSRTIRTEEALLISLAALGPHIQRAHA